MLLRAGLGLLLALAVARAADPASAPARPVLALVGGTSLLTLAEDGRLEALVRLGLRSPGAPLTFRSLAWEGDTAFSQPRDVNYPDLTAQLRRLGAARVLVQFGRMESLDPSATPAAFGAALGSLLDRLAAATPGCIVLGPEPFEASPPVPPALARERNTRLAAFNEAARAAAADRRLPFLDLLAALGPRTPGTPALTADGVQLSPAGCTAVTDALVPELLRLLGDPDRPPDPVRTTPAAMAAVRAAVREKNRLWDHHRRPTNWAFLAGDRTEQAFGRDPHDRSIRALAAETDAWAPLVAGAESRIDETAARHRAPEATR